MRGWLAKAEDALIICHMTRRGRSRDVVRYVLACI